MSATVVVTCFLRHEGDILLVRRAPSMPTYGGRWAAISGYVDTPDPERDARREILQETGLPDDVRLVRAGASLDVEDGGQVWRIFPFLFDVPTRDVTLDREAAAGRWCPPTRMLAMETVPGLWEAYRRVAPTIEDITLDRSHGSMYLTDEALQILRDAAGEAAASRDPRGMLVLADLANRIVGGREAMAAIHSRIRGVMAGASTAADVERRSEEAIASLYEAERSVIAHCRRLVAGRRVATLSRSETVLGSLREGPSEVLVGLSDPGGEGRSVCEALARSGTSAVLVPDMILLSEVARGAVDLVLLGADAVLPGGDFVNKSGTLALLLAAAEGGVPAYVATDRAKYRDDAEPDLEALPPAALVRSLPTGVVTRGNRFDHIPSRLVNAFITEEGFRPPAAFGPGSDHHTAARTTDG